MKTRIMLTILAAVLLLVPAACHAVPSKALSVDHSYSGKEVTLSQFATLTVSLVSNPSTGYSWDENAAISDKTVIDQTHHEFQAGNVPLAGAPGTEVWTFTALQPGTATISLEYRSSVESSISSDSFTLKVSVK
jgi:inhibitor of cysteine peptidase